ncbi:dihydrofolate reductase [Pediococcus pentosaceus]
MEKRCLNRKNIVLSHHPTSLPDSVVGVGSLSELQAIFETHPNEKFYIIGGSHLYNALLSQADELLITRIQKIINVRFSHLILPKMNLNWLV